MRPKRTFDPVTLLVAAGVLCFLGGFSALFRAGNPLFSISVGLGGMALCFTVGAKIAWSELQCSRKQRGE